MSPKAFPEKKGDRNQPNVRLASRLRALLPLWEFNHVWPTFPIARMLDTVVLSFVRLFFAVPLLCSLDFGLLKFLRGLLGLIHSVRNSLVGPQASILTALETS